MSESVQTCCSASVFTEFGCIEGDEIPELYSPVIQFVPGLAFLASVCSHHVLRQWENRVTDQPGDENMGQAGPKGMAWNKKEGYWFSVLRAQGNAIPEFNHLGGGGGVI